MISFALAVVLSMATYKFSLLTKSGCLAAFIIGFGIGALGSLSWLILLIVFALLGFAATLFGLSKKKRMGIQEGENGERSYKNILGVALPPLVFAVLDFIFPSHHDIMSLAYISTIAVAAADTAASELGVKDPRVWMITTLKRVEPGTDGGISISGTVISAVASIIVSLIGYAVIFGSTDLVVLVPFVCGIIGCFADSYVGATIETWGYVSKYGNNCITGIIGGLTAIALMLLIL